MPDYELRLHTIDGNLSVLSTVSTPTDSEARQEAAKLLAGNIAYISVYREGILVGTVQRRKDD